MDTSRTFAVSDWSRPHTLGLLSADLQTRCLFTFLGDKVLIQEVLFDAVVTAPLEAYWTSLVLNKSEFVFLNFSTIERITSQMLRCNRTPGCVSLGNPAGTRIKGWRSPTSAPGRACPGLTCLWFLMSSRTSK